jgi:hypothetical protein
LYFVDMSVLITSLNQFEILNTVFHSNSLSSLFLWLTHYLVKLFPEKLMEISCFCRTWMVISMFTIPVTLCEPALITHLQLVLRSRKTWTYTSTPSYIFLIS